MEKNTEPAFPCDFENRPLQQGMTLRDYFAAKAMQGEWATQKLNEPFWDTSQPDALLNAAEVYYRMADAMLAAREAK